MLSAGAMLGLARLLARMVWKVIMRTRSEFLVTH
jgi:hypothetical protein